MLDQIKTGRVVTPSGSASLIENCLQKLQLGKLLKRRPLHCSIARMYY